MSPEDTLKKKKKSDFDGNLHPKTNNIPFV